MNRALSAYGLPLAAGMALSLGQEPVALPVTILPALVLFALLLQGLDARAAAGRAWLVGFGYFGLTLTWIVNPFYVEADLYSWMAPFAVVMLPAGLAAFWAAGMWVAFRIGQGVAAWALGLILAELARAHLFTGFPWVQFGQGYLDTISAPLMAYIGAEGLSVLIIVVAGVAAAMMRYRWAIIPACVALLLPAIPYSPEPQPSDGPVVRLVQPSAPQDEKWIPERAEAFYRRMIAATEAEPPVDLVVWPETAIPYLLNYSGPILTDIADSSNDTPVIFGVNREEGGLYYNSLAMVGAGGAVDAIYDKRHLVPFGEYIPFGDLLARFGIHGLAAADGAAYAAGQSGDLITVPEVGGILPLICYEGIFPSMSASAERPRALVLITNDAWFGPDAGPRQHFAQARLRAIEQGLPMVRVGNTGLTAMIDARGAVTASLPFETVGYVDATLPQARAETIFARFGSWPFVIVILLSCSAVAIRRRIISG